MTPMAAEPTAVASALVRCDKTWGEKESFVNQLRYARWVQERDGAGALAWLATPKPGAAYAAAALADLRAIEWVPELQRWCEQFEGPKRAALEHALSLLAEPPGERMIWGLDVWHSGEPAGEFPSIYRTVLGQTVPDQT